MLAFGRFRALERGIGAGRAHEREFAAQAIGPHRDAQAGSILQRFIGHRDLGQRLLALGNALDDLGIGLGPVCGECGAIAFLRIAAAHDLDTLFDILRRLHLDRQAEPVEQLRAQFALFRVAAADQHEFRRMPDRQPLALDQVLARLRDIEEQVDQMVLEQIDLVDIQVSAMRAGEQPRLERLLATPQCAFEIERAEHPVLGRAQRQVDKRHRHLGGLARAALVGAAIRFLGRAIVAAPGNRHHRRQQRGQRPCGGGLAGAAIAEHHNPANARIDRADQQGTLHFVLADDGRKGKGHGPCLTHRTAITSKVSG